MLEPFVLEPSSINSFLRRQVTLPAKQKVLCCLYECSAKPYSMRRLAPSKQSGRSKSPPLSNRIRLLDVLVYHPKIKMSIFIGNTLNRDIRNIVYLHCRVRQWLTRATTRPHWASFHIPRRINI